MLAFGWILGVVSLLVFLFSLYRFSQIRKDRPPTSKELTINLIICLVSFAVAGSCLGYVFNIF